MMLNTNDPSSPLLLHHQHHIHDINELDLHDHDTDITLIDHDIQQAQRAAAAAAEFDRFMHQPQQQQPLQQHQQNQQQHLDILTNFNNLTLNTNTTPSHKRPLLFENQNSHHGHQQQQLSHLNHMNQLHQLHHLSPNAPNPHSHHSIPSLPLQLNTSSLSGLTPTADAFLPPAAAPSSVSNNNVVGSSSGSSSSSLIHDNFLREIAELQAEIKSLRSARHADALTLALKDQEIRELRMQLLDARNLLMDVKVCKKRFSAANEPPKSNKNERCSHTLHSTNTDVLSPN
jgi:hypothetical protein